MEGVQSCFASTPSQIPCFSRRVFLSEMRLSKVTLIYYCNQRYSALNMYLFSTYDATFRILGTIWECKVKHAEYTW